MFKPNPQFNDAKPIRHHQFAIKRKSESDDSSDCRSSLESPTTHCYVAGTRPRRTLPRRALSTGRVDINSAALCMDVQSGRPMQTGLRKPHMTPPRSKSATSFRTFDREDSIFPIPNIGTRRIYTPAPPSLLPFYDTTRQSLDVKMDLVRSSSSRSITGKLNNMRIYLGVSYLTQKNVVTHESAESLNCSRPQASPKTAPVSGKRVSMYISDEDLHIYTSTEEDDSDLEAPVIRSIPSSASATFFRKIRIQEMIRNAQIDENMSTSARQVLNQKEPSGPPKKPINLLRPSNHCIPPPIVVIDRCEASDLTCHKTKRVRLSRRGFTSPTYR